MIRNFITIIIVIAGLVYTRYQFFHHDRIPPQIAGGTVYQAIRQDLAELTEKLQTMTEKLFSTSSEPQVEPAPETSNTPLETKNTNRSILNAENILYFTNKERTTRGLSPLKFNAKLTRSANAKSKDMFVYQYFAHTSPKDGKKDFSSFIDHESYRFARVSENLAMGEFTTAQEVVTAWMNSPSHRVNILYADYAEIGASVQAGTMNGQKVSMIVQHFGTPISACPSVSSVTRDALQAVQQTALSSKTTALNLEKQINDQESTMTDTEIDSLIDIYNATIRTYNGLVEEFQELTDTYNEQVKKYDDCIKKLN